MKTGDCIKVRTKTKDDVFGECVFKVEEMGVHCPHCKTNDGIKFVMLGGTGPSARPGYHVIDCPKRVEADVASGITVFLAEAQAKKAMSFYASTAVRKPSNEIEM